MNILKEINTLLENIVPIEVGVFSDIAPTEYVVITPLTDTFELYADNKPHVEVQEVRLSFFSNTNYLKKKKQILDILIDNDFTITDRRYMGHEDDTGYHHYVIDVAKEYFFEREDV